MLNNNWIKKIIPMFMLALVLSIVIGGLPRSVIGNLALHENVAYALPTTEEPTTEAKTTEAESLEAEDQENIQDSEESEETSTVDASLASKLYDKVGKNGSIVYFTEDAPSGMDTVESITGRTDYAAFLKTLHDWNIYGVYTNQLDTITGIVMMFVRFIVGGMMLMALYMAKFLDFLISLAAQSLGVLNLLKYVPENGEALPANLAFLQPIIDTFRGLSEMALIFLSMMFCFILFAMATGFGSANRNRGRYGLRKGGKLLLGFFSVLGFPLMLAGMITSFATLLEENDNYFEDSVASIPLSYIVDTDSWIKRSLAASAGGEGQTEAEQLNGGFILARPDSFPTTKESVLKTVPDEEFVKSLNRVENNSQGVSNDLKTNGEIALKKWMNSEIVTPTEIDSMFGISSKDSGKGNLSKAFTWLKTKLGIGDGDEKRIYQFRLAPYSDKVKAFAGKGFADVTSLDLNEVSIKTASVAGNGGLNVFANSVSMFAQMIGIVFVSFILMLGVISGIFRAITLMLAHGALAMFASIQSMMAALIAYIMMVVTLVSALLLISIYAKVATGVADGLGNLINDKMVEMAIPAVIAVIGKALVIVGIQVGAAILLLKSRRALIAAIEEFFQGLLTKLGFSKDSRAGNALSSMSNANEMGQDFGLATAGAMGAAGASALSGAGKGGLGALQNKEGMRAAMAGAIGGLGAGALSGANKAAGSLSSSIKESIGALDADGSVSPLAGFAGAMQRGSEIAKNNFTKEGKALGQLEDQEEAMDKLESASAAKDKADNHLAGLRAKRAEMEANGASASELAGIDKQIDNAEELASKADKTFNKRAEQAAATGAMMAIGAQAKADAVDQKEGLEQDVESAQGRVADAQASVDQLRAEGVSEDAPEMVHAQSELKAAEAHLAAKQGELDRTNDMITGEIVDTAPVVDASQAISKADEQIIGAQQEVAAVAKDGGLSTPEHAEIRNDAVEAASAVDSDLARVEGQAQQAHDKAKAVNDAHEHLAQNAVYEHDAESVNKAEQGLAHAKSEVAAEQATLNKMTAEGASESAIEAQTQKLNAAQTAEAIAEKVANGTANGNMSVAEVNELSDRHNEMVQARDVQASKVADLQANGASQSEISEAKQVLSGMDTAIASAGAAIATAKAGNMVGQAFTNQDVEASKAAVTSSGQALQSAQTKLDQMQASGAPVEQIQAQQAQVQSLQGQHQANITKAAAMDIKGATASAQQSVSQTKEALATEQNKLSDMKAANAPAEQIKAQEAKVKAATTANDAAVQTLSNISSGAVLTQAHSVAKEAKVQSAERVASAQAKVESLQARSAAGETLGANELATAKRELTEAKAQDHQAGRVLAGMNAQKITGGNTSKEALAQSRQNVKATGSDLSQIQNARTSAQQIASTGNVNSASIVPIKKAQSIRESNQQVAVDRANDNLKKAQNDLNKLMEAKQSGNSQITMKAISKAQEKVRHAEMEKAHESRKMTTIKDQGRSIDKAGKVISSNMKNANSKLSKAQEAKAQAQESYKSAVKSGGVNSATIGKVKESISKDKELVKKEGEGKFRAFKKAEIEQTEKLRNKRETRRRNGTSLDAMRKRDERERKFRHRYNDND